MKNDTSTDSLTALIYNFAKPLSFYYYNIALNELSYKEKQKFEAFINNNKTLIPKYNFLMFFHYINNEKGLIYYENITDKEIDYCFEYLKNNPKFLNLLYKKQFIDKFFNNQDKNQTLLNELYYKIIFSEYNTYISTSKNIKFIETNFHIQPNIEYIQEKLKSSKYTSKNINIIRFNYPKKILNIEYKQKIAGKIYENTYYNLAILAILEQSINHFFSYKNALGLDNKKHTELKSYVQSFIDNNDFIKQEINEFLKNKLDRAKSNKSIYQKLLLDINLEEKHNINKKIKI